MLEKTNSDYNIILSIGGIKLLYVIGDLVAIDKLTSNFNNKEEFINYIKATLLIRETVDDIILEHPYTITEDGVKKKIIVKEDFLFKNRQSFISESKENIIRKMITFLDRYENVVRISKQPSENIYLKKFIDKLLEVGKGSSQDNRKYYQKILADIEHNLINSYKQTRDLAIDIDNYYVSLREKFPERDVFFLKPVNKSVNLTEAEDIMSKIQVVYTPVKWTDPETKRNYNLHDVGFFKKEAYTNPLILMEHINKSNIDLTSEHGEYIQELYEKGEMDEIYSFLDIDQMRDWGISDGTTNPEIYKGKSK